MVGVGESAVVEGTSLIPAPKYLWRTFSSILISADKKYPNSIIQIDNLHRDLR
jgi:hypothetical protein